MADLVDMQGHVDHLSIHVVHAAGNHVLDHVVQHDGVLGDIDLVASVQDVGDHLVPVDVVQEVDRIALIENVVSNKISVDEDHVVDRIAYAEDVVVNPIVQIREDHVMNCAVEVHKAILLMNLNELRNRVLQLAVGVDQIVPVEGVEEDYKIASVLVKKGTLLVVHHIKDDAVILKEINLLLIGM